MDQIKKQEMLNRFDEKFPWRIYGIAGEPKTEFIESKNKPEDIKSFIQSEINTAIAEERSRIVKELEKCKDDENIWDYIYALKK